MLRLCTDDAVYKNNRLYFIAVTNLSGHDIRTASLKRKLWVRREFTQKDLNCLYKILINMNHGLLDDYSAAICEQTM